MSTPDELQELYDRINKKNTPPPTNDGPDELEALYAKYGPGPRKATAAHVAQKKGGRRAYDALLELGEDDDTQLAAMGFDDYTIKNFKAHPDYQPGRVSRMLKGEGAPGTLKGKVESLPVVAQVNAFLEGAGRFPKGVAQKLEHLFRDPDSVALRDVETRVGDVQTAANEEGRTGTGVARFLGSLLSPAGKGLGKAKLFSAEGGKALLRSGAEGVAHGVAQPIDAPGANFWGKTMEQGAMGGGLNMAATALLGPTLERFASKKWNAKTGAPIDPEVQRVMDRPGGSTLAPSTILQKIKPKSPETRGAMGAIDDSMSVFEQALARHGVGMNEGGIVKNEIVRKAQAEKNRFSKLFESFRRETGAIDDVEFPSAIAAIDDKVSKLKLDLLNVKENEAEIGALLAFKDRLTKKKAVPDIPEKRDQFGYLLEPGIKGRPESKISYERGDVTRQTVGQDLAAYYKGAGVITGKPGADVLGAIKSGLETDLEEAIKLSGDPRLIAKGLSIRNEYRKYKELFGDEDVKALSQTMEPNAVLGRVLGGGPEKANKLYGILGQEGRDAFNLGVAKQAIGKSINERTGELDPGLVATRIAEVMDSSGVVLPKKQKDMLEGLKNTMQAIQANKAEARDSTGALVRSAGGALRMTSMVSGMYQYLRDHGVDAMFSSPAGRRYLFAMRDIDPSSSKANMLMAAFLNSVRTAPAREAALGVGFKPLDPDRWIEEHPEYRK